jgi:DNA repair photolyase
MDMKITEIHSKAILSTSQVYDYAINPYIGCQHACSYCYARFMKRFTGHKEAWGEFVDVKINAAELLPAEIKKKKRGRVWVSGVCDPYQPLEAKYRLTRKCLEILAQQGWPVTIQTRSALVARDVDVLRKMADLEVGFSITTAKDEIRQIFEPHAPAIHKRLEAIAALHQEGLRTFVMIAPLLPGAEDLVEELAGNVNYILLDRMNYHHADRIYARYGWNDKNTEEYFRGIGGKIAGDCKRLGIECRSVY